MHRKNPTDYSVGIHYLVLFQIIQLRISFILVIFLLCRSDIFALRKHNDGDMFCDAKRDIFDDIKSDVHSLRSYAICCPKATRCDTNPRLRSKHIVCKTHIASQREISQIPQGIYIAKQKICFPKKADFVVLLGISP